MKLITKIVAVLATCVVIAVAEYLLLGTFDTVFPAYIAGAIIGFVLGEYKRRKRNDRR